MTKWEQVIQKLHRMIEEKLKGRDFDFPTEEALCRQLQVSRTTLRRALAALTKEGLLVTRQGSGRELTGKLPDPSPNRLALLLSFPQSYRSPSLVEQVRLSAQNAGFSLLVYDLQQNFQTERRVLSELLESPPRGLLLERFSAFPDPNTDLLQALIAPPLSVPVVSLFGPVRASGFPESVHAFPIPFAAEDSLQGARLLVRALTALGHRRIGGIFSSCCLPDTCRLECLLTALREASLPVDTDFFFLPGNLETSALLDGRESRLDSFLQNIAGSCTALICSDDLLAAAVLFRLSSHGLAVPKDLSLASFEGSYLHQLSMIQTASLSGAAGLGECAADLLLQKIGGNHPESILLPLSLETGNSLQSV